MNLPSPASCCCLITNFGSPILFPNTGIHFPTLRNHQLHCSSQMIRSPDAFQFVGNPADADLWQGRKVSIRHCIVLLLVASLMLTYTHTNSISIIGGTYTINGRNIAPLTSLAVIQHIHKRERHWELLGSLEITCPF